jgi:release factor glutamine methyltransferase
MRYKTLLDQAKTRSDNPAIAEYLLQGLTNKKRYELYADTSDVPEELLTRFHNLLKTKKPDLPVQYLIHKAYFLSYELYVDERVMIPRFETEELVEKTADKTKNPKTILDIGAGSGAIAIAMADLFPNTKLVATDVSVGALEVTKINISNYKMTDRIALSQNDLFPPPSNEKFDLIISNPPYIPIDEIETLPPTVKNYEPRLALNGGKQGFEIIERIINQAPNYLATNGLLALEIDPRQLDLIRNLTLSAEFEKDNQGFIRYAFIKF